MNTTGSVIKEYAINDPRSRVFMVNPPPAGTVVVEAEYAVLPSAYLINDAIGTGEWVGGDDSGDSSYETALLNWVMHRALLEETEEGSEMKADYYLKQFYEALK